MAPNWIVFFCHFRLLPSSLMTINVSLRGERRRSRGQGFYARLVLNQGSELPGRNCELLFFAAAAVPVLRRRSGLGWFCLNIQNWSWDGWGRGVFGNSATINGQSEPYAFVKAEWAY